MMQEPAGFWRRNDTLTVFALLALFVLALTLHAWLSRPNLDQYGDMAENYAWGMLWQWGYYKHPPFFGWVTAAWFTIFPRTDFAYFLLAAVNSALALFALFRISRRYGGPELGILAVLLAMVMPPNSFLALNYNANSAMTPLWAGIFLFYLRGLEGRRLGDAVILGLLAGCAMLTKYHSAVLLGALFLHALGDRQARPLLFSAFGLVAAGVFALTIAGHVAWLIRNDFPPIAYAAHKGDGGMVPMLLSIPRFLVAPILYCGLAMLFALLMRNRGDGYPLIVIQGLRDLRRSVEGRALIVFAVVPMLLTIVLGLAVSAELSPVWGTPFYICFPLIIALMVPEALRRANLSRVKIAVGVFLAVIVMIAPSWRSVEEGMNVARYQVPLAAMAKEVDGLWRTFGDGRPGPIVIGDQVFANSTAFYSDYHPRVLQANSFAFSRDYLDQTGLVRQGTIAICLADDDNCLQTVDGIMPQDAQEHRFFLKSLDGKQNFGLLVRVAPPRAGG